MTFFAFSIEMESLKHPHSKDMNYNIYSKSIIVTQNNYYSLLSGIITTGNDSITTRSSVAKT
jgi:hypothetical protein